MVGDFIIWLRTWCRQNWFCVHRYEAHTIHGCDRDYDYLECTKCGKIRDLA